MSQLFDWYLLPQFSFEERNNSEFEKLLNDPNLFSITLVTEEDIKDKPEEYTLPLAIYGELKSKNIYPLDNTGTKFLYIIPSEYPGKLNFEIPGKAHVASQIGAGFCTAILSCSFKIKTQTQFCVSLSKKCQEKITPEEPEFLLGIMQKSVLNNISKNKKPEKKQQLILLNTIYFSDKNIEKAQILNDAMCCTRSLINMPPNILNPETYETFLYSLLRKESEKLEDPNHIRMEVYNFDKLKSEGCGLICAVGKGSHYKPRIIKLTYFPKTSIEKPLHISLVGKGITFDSGGYDLKPSTGMRQMKKDMGGAASVTGIFFAIARLNLPIRITCYLPLAENMVSGGAMCPGDIYTARNGTKVEIENTDAEGRLILADAISLACEEKPDWLIDLATLTGAARVSLGTMVDSLFGNNAELSELFYKTGVDTGDWVWNMPLPSDYNSYYDSNVCDFMNSSSSGYAGSITAALFLKKFVAIEKWNHIDTFMWCDKPASLWAEAGPTAKCVRLVTKTIENYVLKNERLS